MRVEREMLFVETVQRGDRSLVLLGGVAENVPDRIANLFLSVDEARWLQAAALPAALAALALEVPSEPPVKVRDASNDDGQIAGQLAIDG